MATAPGRLVHGLSPMQHGSAHGSRLPVRWCLALSAVRFSAVADPYNQHQEPFFLDGIENPIFSNSNAPSFAVTKLLASRRARAMRSSSMAAAILCLSLRSIRGRSFVACLRISIL